MPTTPMSSAAVRRAAVLVVLGLAVTLTACSGGEDDAGSAASPSSPASSGAATAGTTQPEAASTTGAASTAQPGEITDAAQLAAVMTAAMREAGTAKLALVVTAGGASVEGAGALKVGDDPAIQLAATVAGRLVKVRVVGGGAYVSPGRSVMGKSWIKIDPDGGDTVSKTFAALVTGLRGVVGVSAVQTGFDKASSFKDLGARTIEGEQTHGYVVGLDEDALRAVIGRQTGGGDDVDLTGAKATYTVYLDDAGLPRRIATETTFGGRSTKHVADYTAWGSAVTIEPPPSSQVIDSSQVG